MATNDKKLKELKPPKITKKNLVKTLIGAIPAAYTKFKKSKQKFKTDEQKFVKQEKDKVKTLTTQANKTYNDLTPNQKKVYDSLGNQPGMSTKKKIAIALGLATTAGLSKFGYDVKQEMNKAKGGYVKMNRGGEAKRKSSSFKKSRGTGAAIKGTKFKGVF